MYAFISSWGRDHERLPLLALLDPCTPQVFGQLLIGTLIRRKSLIRRNSSEPVCQQEIRFLPRDGCDEARIPTAMWGEIMNMIIDVQSSHDSRYLLDEWKRSEPLTAWRASFTKSVKQAIGQGACKDLRYYGLTPGVKGVGCHSSEQTIERAFDRRERADNARGSRDAPRPPGRRSREAECCQIKVAITSHRIPEFRLE